MAHGVWHMAYGSEVTIRHRPYAIGGLLRGLLRPLTVDSLQKIHDLRHNVLHNPLTQGA
jgi:hypothetical protein